ncbi:nitroreductase family protein [Romboutsia sp.]|uniref:nitroreductase family protein n=1 Tax=Romboutsia sp. TaxID=1965302 RepID=UPI002C7F480F|nr:nitroreductase family protein [Romboutsia sp.]HSQ88516.1 nitroreductase family protein [Romboutsia sp.]
MELYDAIFYRRTIRNYSNKNINAPLMEEVKKICNDITYLNEDLRIKAHVVERGHLIHLLMGKKCKIKAPHYIVVTSNKGEDYLQNIGFAIEKVVLQLTTLGLGTCWLDCSLKREDIMEFIDLDDIETDDVNLNDFEDSCENENTKNNKEDDIENPYIIIAFGYAQEQEKLFKAIKVDQDRKSIKHISKKMDRKWIKVLNAVRVAPSIKNCQPWMFYYSKDGIHIYEEKQKKSLENMTHISMGIALRHFDMACEKYNISVTYNKIDKKRKIGKKYYISILEEY